MTAADGGRIKHDYHARIRLFPDELVDHIQHAVQGACRLAFGVGQ